MDENTFETIKYMTIHLFLFLFKNVIAKWLIKLSNSPNNEKTELELMKQKLNSLQEQIREISPTSDYAKYAKMERQINNLNDEIKKKETELFYKNLNLNFLTTPKNQNVFQKIINSYTFKFSMYFINIIEYFLLKNKFFEVEYESNKNNIVVNHFYNENKNSYYALIPVYRILIAETIVLNSLCNLIQKIF